MIVIGGDVVEEVTIAFARLLGFVEGEDGDAFAVGEVRGQG